MRAINDNRGGNRTLLEIAVDVAGVLVVSAIILGLLSTFVLSSVHAQEPNIIGVATVTDGDTIRIGDIRIRLNGIDAPEHGAMCGDADVYQKSRDALTAVIGQAPVNCAVSGDDRYGRKIATCTQAGQDIAASQVEVGWARDWARYSHGAYAENERHARAAHRGIWEHECPEIWGDRNYTN